MPRVRFEITSPVLEEKIESYLMSTGIKSKYDKMYLHWKHEVSFKFKFHRLYERIIYATHMKLGKGNVINFLILTFWK